MYKTYSGAELRMNSVCDVTNRLDIFGPITQDMQIIRGRLRYMDSVNLRT